MGKQAAFFMTSIDEGRFLSALHQIAPIRILRNTFLNEAKMDADPLHLAETTKGESNFSLINKSLKSHVKYDFYPSQSYYCIDLMESEVVQFHRCAGNAWLEEGRLWFDERTVQGHKKSPDFLKWANAVLRWIRTHYTKDESGLYLIGPEALFLSKSGQLQLGRPPQPPLLVEERKRLLGK